MNEPKQCGPGMMRGSPGEEVSLRSILRAWPAIEPSCGFDAAVWQRLERLETASAWSGIRRFGHPRPAWAAAAALVVGALLGAMLARQAVPTPSSVHRSGAVLLHTETLAGAYVALVAGGGP